MKREMSAICRVYLRYSVRSFYELNSRGTFRFDKLNREAFELCKLNGEVFANDMYKGLFTIYLFHGTRGIIFQSSRSTSRSTGNAEGIEISLEQIRANDRYSEYK